MYKCQGTSLEDARTLHSSRCSMRWLSSSMRRMSVEGSVDVEGWISSQDDNRMTAREKDQCM